MWQKKIIPRRHRFVTKPAYTEYASFSDYSAGDGTWKASFYSYWYFWPSWPQWTFSWASAMTPSTSSTRP